VKSRKFIYNLLILSAFLLGLPWIVYQLFFVKKRRRGIAQRFGAAPRMDGPMVWCHAVSVGEVRAIQPMLSLLKEDRRTADRVVLSTVTPTGQETALRECGFVKSIFFFPLDLPYIAVKAIKRVKPELFITAETEIWPNFFFACFRKRIPVVIVNGRISDGSFSRYMRFRWFFGPILRNVTLLLMQSDEDARRIIGIGARPESVHVTGNTKYDRVPEKVELPRSVEQWAEDGFLFVAGSTHAGEEAIVLDAFARMRNRGLKVALVPRHPERFDEVAGLLEQKGCDFRRFSSVGGKDEIGEKILLVDAMGVLDGFYALSSAAFVGGSLVPVGGHNLLEPAMHGVPVLTGPHLQNFREMAESMISTGRCTVVNDTEELVQAIDSLIEKSEVPGIPGGSPPSGTVEAKGASARNANWIFRILDTGSSR
jgi:3-deoxy-D-manno-octulosonic-acid transferase